MVQKRPQKQKNKVPITGAPQDIDNKLVVQKSNPLYGLWRSELSLADFKILDIYLSRINSHNPEYDTVLFEKGEIEKILGVKKINLQELKSRIRHMCTAVEVNDPTKTRAFRLVTLFDEAECEQGDNGLWEVRLTCSRAARKYFFNIENLGYFRYKLRTVTRLHSRYSYILFMYLEKNRHMHSSWEVDLDELKLLLKCDQEETYREYKRFNAQILKRCHKELTENTECQFTYKPVKRGRTVRGIRFYLATVADQLDGQLSLDDIATAHIPVDNDEKANAYSTEMLGFLAGACDYEFDNPEMRVLFDLVLRLYPYTTDGGIECFNYLRQKYNLLALYSGKRKISSRFGYLKTLIEADIEEHTA